MTLPSFTLPAASSQYRLIRAFGRSKLLTNGYHPIGLLALNGTLYGVARGGGAYGRGTVYAMKSDGVKVVYSFGATQSDGSEPSAAPIALNGTLYGVTEDGGACGAGTVFSLTTTGTEKVVHSFCNTDGGNPEGSLLAIHGKLYGTASTLGGTSANIGGTVFAMTTTGDYRVLHSFDAAKGDGYSPSGDLAVVNGVLYGTTLNGGTACSDYPGCGTVFSITTGGKEKVLYSFRGLNAGDGAQPRGGITNVDGMLYGATFFGGDDTCHAGCGVVFGMSTTGTETILYRFDAASNGLNPGAGVIAFNGVLYGTTTRGGSGYCGTDQGCGTLYSLTPTGTEAVVHAFAGSPDDGAAPAANLVSLGGSLYGTTISGGFNRPARCRATIDAPDPGCGTLFRFTP